MNNMRHRPNSAGFTLIEIVLAVAIFSLLGLMVVSAFIYGRESTAAAVDRSRAAELANEGIEAVRNVASTNYSNLAAYTNGTVYYVTVVANQWSLVTAPIVIDNTFTRTAVFADGPGGSRQLTVTVNWRENPTRQGKVSASTYLSNWQAATAAPNKTGVFVYADGGTTTDRMTYRLLLPTGVWTAPTAMPDVDASTTNRVARSVKLFSAQTGSVKAVVSRHFDGTKQYIYGTVWNGSSWSTPQLLASWTSSDWLDVGNFGGSFMANGTFVSVYSDNSNRPKYNTWNGSSWSTQASLPALSGSGNIPTAIVVAARPGANEVMTAILDFTTATETSYYANGSWEGYTTQGNNGPTNGRKLIDFAWSPVKPTVGGLVYAANQNDRSMKMRVFTADGTGSGSWSPVANTPQQPSGSYIGSVGITPRPTGADDFIACDKDLQTPPSIYCYQALPEPSGFNSVTNGLITDQTADGPQRSFDLSYEFQNGLTGLNAYSDNTANAKLKKYDSNSTTWDASPLTLPSAGGIAVKTRLAGKPNSNDAMVIVADANKNLYSVVFDGAHNTLYSTPAGNAWTAHNANGPSTSAVWFDFAWDS